MYSRMKFLAFVFSDGGSTLYWSTGVHYTLEYMVALECTTTGSSRVVLQYWRTSSALVVETEHLLYNWENFHMRTQLN